MSLELPHFKSELEEADWWYEHREEVEAEFIVAAAKGQLTQKTRVDQPAVPPIEVNLDDLERAGTILMNGRQPAVDSLTRKADLRRAS